MGVPARMRRPPEGLAVQAQGIPAVDLQNHIPRRHPQTPGAAGHGDPALHEAKFDGWHGRSRLAGPEEDRVVVVQPSHQQGIQDRQRFLQAGEALDALPALLVPAPVDGSRVLHHGVVVPEGLPEVVQEARGGPGGGHGNLGVCAPLDQEPGSPLLPPHPGNVEWREAISIHLIHIRSLVQEEGNASLVAGSRRTVEPAPEIGRHCRATKPVARCNPRRRGQAPAPA